MKQAKRIAAAMCVGAVLTNGLMAQAASIPQAASIWVGDLYAEGRSVPTLKSADEVKLPIIRYQDNTYFPLRTAGELTGKTVGWDASTRTVSLSGTVDRIYPDNNVQSSAIPEDGNLKIQSAPEIKVVVDGKAAALKDANGKPVYPLIYADSTYVPLRSIGELTGFEVTWAKNSGGAEDIYIRTAMTDTQIQAANAYLYAQIDHLIDLHDSTSLLIQKELTEATRTESVSSMAKALEAMEAEKCPDVPVLTESDKLLRDAIKNASETMERMRTAPLADVPSIASKEFRYSAEQNIYIPMIDMKMTLDQKGVIDDSKFLEYNINR